MLRVDVGLHFSGDYPEVGNLLDDWWYLMVQSEGMLVQQRERKREVADGFRGLSLLTLWERLILAVFSLTPARSRWERETTPRVLSKRCDQSSERKAPSPLSTLRPACGTTEDGRPARAVQKRRRPIAFLTKRTHLSVDFTALMQKNEAILTHFKAIF